MAQETAGTAPDQMATAGTNRSERRAAGNAERRTEQHPAAVATFGGSRQEDQKSGVVHGVGVARKVFWFAIILVSLAVWPTYMGWLIEPGEGAGYYFGIVGGSMMLLMLLYPVRKHMAFARGWGPLRYWFMMHMLFGIAGPLLVLFHSTFHIKSINAAVALYSMLIVAGSGIVGRFIYRRIHNGLYGRKSSLDELQKAVDLKTQADSEIALMVDLSGTGERLKNFRNAAFAKGEGILKRFWKFMTFGWRMRSVKRHARHDLWLAMLKIAQARGWGKELQQQHFQEAQEHVSEYLLAVRTAAQFNTYESLFRLWHILHTPFVWMLFISGVVHVVAVNMY